MHSAAWWKASVVLIVDKSGLLKNPACKLNEGIFPNSVNSWAGFGKNKYNYFDPFFLFCHFKETYFIALWIIFSLTWMSYRIKKKKSVEFTSQGKWKSVLWTSSWNFPIKARLSTVLLFKLFSDIILEKKKKNWHAHKCLHIKCRVEIPFFIR